MVAIRQPKNTLLAKHTIRARLKYSVARTLTLTLKVPRRGEKGAAFAGEMSGFTFGYYSLSPVLKSGPAAINAVLYLAKEVCKSPFNHHVDGIYTGYKQPPWCPPYVFDIITAK